MANVQGKVQVNRRLRNLNARWDRALQKKLNGIGLEGVKIAQRIVNHGEKGILTDTGAMSASMYVVSPDFKNAYEKSVSNMLSQYTEKYSLEHGLARVAPPVVCGKKQAGFASSSKVLGWWNRGHVNRFTGSFEQAPIMRQARAEITPIAKRRLSNVLGSNKTGTGD